MRKRDRVFNPQGVTTIISKLGTVCTITYDKKVWYRAEDISAIYNENRDLDYLVKKNCISKGIRNFRVDGHHSRFLDIDNVERLLTAIHVKNVLDAISWLVQKPQKPKTEALPKTSDELIALARKESVSEITNRSFRNSPKRSESISDGYVIDVNNQYSLLR